MPIEPRFYLKDLLLPGVILFPPNAREGRAAFKVHFGFDAPPFDVTRGKQSWTNDPAAGKGVNFPGSAAYPAYQVPESDAFIGGNKVNPQYLSSKKEMFDLMIEIQDDTGVALRAGHIFTGLVNPLKAGPSGREDWLLGSARVGDLLFEKYAAGEGAPGKWQMNGGVLKWMTESPPSDNDMPVVPPPIRALLDAEMWYYPPFGDAYVGLKAITPPTSTPAGTDAKLDLIISLLRALVERG